MFLMRHGAPLERVLRIIWAAINMWPLCGQNMGVSQLILPQKNLRRRNSGAI